MARPVGSHGEETRERILAVAQQLFTQQGYDKTALRDIAERLGITKAALYHYFARKQDILIELHRRLETLGIEVLEELETAEDGPARTEMWPRLANTMIDFMVENRDLIRMHGANRQAIAALGEEHEERDVDARFLKILASPAMSVRQRVRMASMVGAITEVFGESSSAFEDVPSETLAELVREVVAELALPPSGR